MAAFNRFNAWTDTMVEGANCASDQFAIALTNVAPSASNTVLADITQIAYTGVGSRNLTTTSSSQTAGVYSLVFANLTIGTATTTPTFRYVVIYDDTLSGDPLVGWYDIGATTIPANTSLIFSGMGLDLNDAAFNPATLFTGGYTGGWYDPSDPSTLWQNSTRTTPVTADGQPVGCIDDKSGNGNHLIQASSSLRPLYKTSGGLHWLEFDGVDDVLQSALPAFGSPTAFYYAVSCESFSATSKAIFHTNRLNNVTGTARIHGGTATDNLTMADGVAGSNWNGHSGSHTVGQPSVLAMQLDRSVGVYTDAVIPRINGNVVTPTWANGTANPASGTFVNATISLAFDASRWGGKVYGAIMVSKVLTSGDANSLDGFLKTKAGI